MIHLYEDGAFDVEVCADLKITEKEFDRRYVRDELFQQLVDAGRVLSKRWWYHQVRISLRDKSFNGKLFIDVMKNQFGWSDKVENTEKISESISELELDQHIESLLKKRGQSDKTDAEIVSGHR